ncbi:unnamed protein product [Musa hybrid cultivar]
MLYLLPMSAPRRASTSPGKLEFICQRFQVALQTCYCIASTSRQEVSEDLIRRGKGNDIIIVTTTITIATATGFRGTPRRRRTARPSRHMTG